MGKLFENQKKYITGGLSRFHTPGHSGQSGAIPYFGQILPFDVTEVEDFDSLYHADGVIKSTEERLAGFFGAKASLISSGGCTLAIQAMLALACTEKSQVLMGRNAHRSAVSAAALLGLNPVWAYPEPGGVVTPKQIKEGLEQHNNISAVYLTSPNYYGQLCDIKTISEICRKSGVPLIVDNAHGSHLGFLSQNLHPLHLGADMTACSLHKTLPVLTGGALLNIKNEKFIPRAKEKTALFGSTSPSYLTMASMDLLADRLDSGFKQDFLLLESRAEALKKYATGCGLTLPDGLCDPVRFTLHTGKNGIDGGTAYRIFRECGAVAEYYDAEYIVFILTPFHTQHDFARLYDGITKLKGMAGKSSNKITKLAPPPRTVQALPLRDAVFAKSETADIKDAEGRIAADSVTPCPPGIPVLIPGEMIDRQVLEYLKSCGIKEVRVCS